MLKEGMNLKISRSLLIKNDSIQKVTIQLAKFFQQENFGYEMKMKLNKLYYQREENENRQ